MAVILLRLSGGHVSLEFNESDIPLVAAAVRERFGVPGKRYDVMCVEYLFGGCRFTFYNAWEDPCLISKSDAGDRILEELCARLR